MQHMGRTMLNGTIAGAAATTTMTAFMRLAQYTGNYRRELPPTNVTQAALRTLHVQHRVSSEQETVLIGLAHWAFGMVAGALFGLMIKANRHLPRWLAGVVFALVVWSVSYMGWVPALGILPQPWNQRKEHGWMPFLAHIVYGATLGVVFGRLERR